ncbi:hypothetical protein ACFQ1E_20190 [Sphingomonas canadensis]|uniref:Secreted protein n=1 Tax=Sphingomonas canadensis TaxID=1219257 RepID=A0ABW3HAZ4_9SPHN|nr:hypothetical protein [Sphingomonas canadensis]MCW3838422.1 hypothetical protein [Sphingomonas canadensis]
MNRSIARGIAMLAIGSAALALAACGGKPEESNVETNLIVNEEVVNEVAENVVEPAPVVQNVARAPAPRGAEFGNTTSETIDDAEAVGMTSRVDRGEGEKPAQ